MQDLWQARYQTLLITSLKEFIDINVNSDMIRKNVELLGLNGKIAAAFLNAKTLKMM